MISDRLDVSSRHCLHERIATGAETSSSKVGPPASADSQLSFLAPDAAELAPSVRQALANPIRTPYGLEWAELTARLTATLGAVLGASDMPFVMPGSGAVGMEATLFSLIASRERVVVCATGHGGDELIGMARRHGLEVAVVPVEPGEPVDVALVADIAEGASAVLCMHVEPSTGVRHPIDELALVAHTAGAMLIVDATSSAGVERLAVDTTGISALVTVPENGLEGPAGLVVVALGPRGRERLDSCGSQSPSWYLDLGRWDAHRRMHGGWQPQPVPMPTSLICALAASLSRLVDEGLDERVLERARLAARLREGLRAIGMPPIATDGCEASLVTVVRSGEAPSVADHLREEHGLVVALGLAPMQDALRIGLLGPCARDAMVDRLLAALRASVRRVDRLVTDRNSP